MTPTANSLNRILSTAGRWSLVFAAAVLPFELKNPMLSAGPFEITTVEMALYLVIAIWFLWKGTSRISSKQEQTQETMRKFGMSPFSCARAAVVLWAAVVVISALWAPTDKTAALKFALRNLAGCALFFAASDLAADGRSAARVCTALVAGSCVSAVAGIAEVRWPQAAAFLMNFKTQPSLTGAYLRASGTFQYVNIASMYWEACLPLAFTIPLLWSRRSRNRWWLCASASASLVLSAAVLAGASRAGIVIAILIPTFLILLSRHSARNLRIPSGITLVFLLSMITVQSATGGLPALRLTRDVSGWYRVEYRDYPAELKLQAGKLVKVPLTIRNDGTIPWRARGPQSVAVTYHWLDAAGKTILVWQGVRSEIPSDVEPGGTVELEAWVAPPASPGSYAMQWDMLQQDVAWFSIFAPGKAHVKVEVVPSGAASVSPEYRIPIGLPLASQPARRDLWRAALRLWLKNPLLGVGPDNFRRLYGPVLGLKNYDHRIHANSLYLETLASGGLFGAVGLLAVLTAVWASIHRAWSASKEISDRLLLVGVATGLAAFCIHGLVDYFLPFTPTYGLFWILAGLGVSLERMQESK